VVNCEMDEEMKRIRRQKKEARRAAGWLWLSCFLLPLSGIVQRFCSSLTAMSTLNPHEIPRLFLNSAIYYGRKAPPIVPFPRYPFPHGRRSIPYAPISMLLGKRKVKASLQLLPGQLTSEIEYHMFCLSRLVRLPARQVISLSITSSFSPDCSCVRDRNATFTIPRARPHPVPLHLGALSQRSRARRWDRQRGWGSAVNRHWVEGIKRPHLASLTATR
jgi:hypothetical protein